MAFSQTTTSKKRATGLRFHAGTWDGASVTEGGLKTGLSKVVGFSLTGVGTTACNLKTNLATGVSGGTITFEFASSDVGRWSAWGY